jgi:hypothetical protein
MAAGHSRSENRSASIKAKTRAKVPQGRQAVPIAGAGLRSGARQAPPKHCVADHGAGHVAVHIDSAMDIAVRQADSNARDHACDTQRLVSAEMLCALADEIEARLGFAGAGARFSPLET